ncbi:VOC family protein [Bordetella sp. N]|uniref:2-oxoadipate dioxygenase/decarboxylase HglS n=1 Tax=Bordetella sp. N TaxID=1746199 RepID=UPI000710DB6E|nr:VOC family protein [Bordetella sp. N]ALM81981.1 hypothetical protein ASB57_02465 [Bordetella sp. N]
MSTTAAFVDSDEIRSRFSRAMSEMYREEVPKYGTLIDLVEDINAACLQATPALRQRLERDGELDRLSVERHGAIRLGSAQELADMRRIFAVMGMKAVGYYDLSVAGVPVHSTAFRPVDDAALSRNPFRVFTSLLRLELIDDTQLREEAAAILAKRAIFTPRALALTAEFEARGGLTDAQAGEFVNEVRETFRWHGDATVSAATYHKLHDAHRLIADVVCFKGPHINHLTPRTLDIDAAQAEMPKRGIAAKDVIEGPPRREHPILLRQTSFKALQERIAFVGDEQAGAGTHTARFGEIEQRGMALTSKGRTLYDELLGQVRDTGGAGNAGANYEDRLADAFRAFPDDLEQIRQQGLAFFRYSLEDIKKAKPVLETAGWDLDALIAAGAVVASPIIYEDFLPVSAAGIFQSNLGGTEQKSYAANAAKQAFERDLGAQVLDEIALYEQSEQASLEALRHLLGMGVTV